VKIAIKSKNNYLQDAITSSKFDAKFVSPDDADMLIQDYPNYILVSEQQIPKPISLAKLISSLEFTSKTKNISFSDLEINLINSTLSHEHLTVILTNKELDILKALIERHSIGKKELIEYALGFSQEAQTSALESHVYRIRQKLSELGSKVKIETDGTSFIIFA
jgi:two-component SAPR family response regulator